MALWTIYFSGLELKAMLSDQRNKQLQKKRITEFQMKNEKTLSKKLQSRLECLRMKCTNYMERNTMNCPKLYGQHKKTPL